MARLEVEIGADVKELQKGIDQAEKELEKLRQQKAVNLKLGVDNTSLNKQIADTKNQLNGLNTSLNASTKAVAGFQKQTASGSNTLTQFSRIAQDAPFGIIGIGNNLTATAEAFGNLSKQSGGAGNALKAIASSIAGTGGILLGVSLLTTAFTYLAQNGLTVGDVIDRLRGNFDAFGAELNKLSVEAAKNSGQEIANLKALVSVAQDDTNSRKERLLAVEKLQDAYPGYFGNLDKEKILNGDLTDVTKDLTKAIIARAEATAIADKIGELAAKKLELQIKKENEIPRLKALQEQLRLAKENLKTTNDIAGAGYRLGGITTALGLATEKIKDLNQEIYNIQLQQDKLAGRLNQKTEDSIGLLEKKAVVEKQAKQTVFDTPQVKALDTITAAPLVIPPVNYLPFTDSIAQAAVVVDRELLRMELAMQEFNDNINALISTSITDTFTSLGTAIGIAISEGTSVLDAVGNTLLQSLGKLLSAIGTELIKLGTAAIVAGTVTQTFGTIVGIGAGLAAIAAGTALSALGSAAGNTANKNVRAASESGATANTNYSSSSASYGSSGGFGGNSVVFEISGQSLIGVLSNTLDKNKRLGI